jgi:hypothetical protein
LFSGLNEPALFIPDCIEGGAVAGACENGDVSVIAFQLVHGTRQQPLQRQKRIGAGLGKRRPPQLKSRQ